MGEGESLAKKEPSVRQQKNSLGKGSCRLLKKPVTHGSLYSREAFFLMRKNSIEPRESLGAEWIYHICDEKSIYGQHRASECAILKQI